MRGAFKRTIKAIPAVGPALLRVRGWLRNQPAFINSGQYWEDRYKAGGNSGAGSYNRLAQFKSEILNDFVVQNKIESVIEFGCGDGSQLGLAKYPRYTGVDVSAKAVSICREKYGTDPTKDFFTVDTLPPTTRAELALSLDVIYHLIEDQVFDLYMRRLFSSAKGYVIIYSSNRDKVETVHHVRHRRFTDWIDNTRPDWHLLNTIRNKYPFDNNDPNNTSFADFYIYSNRLSA